MKALKVIAILYGLFVLGISIAALAVPCSLINKIVYIIAYPIILLALVAVYVDMFDGEIK